MVKVIEPTLFSLLDSYLNQYLPCQRNCSLHTIRSYRFSLTQYLYYLKDEVKIPLEKVTFKTYTQSISAHLDWLENINKCSISTRNLRLACIKAFYAYACSNEPLALVHVTSINKIPVKKTAESPNIKYMSIEAIQAILKQPDTKTMLGLRDQVLMILLEPV